MNEARNGSKFLGRDHHPPAFTMWLAGGGTRRGVTIGRTDELGYNVVEDPIDVHDLHATMSRLLGIDHEQLTYKFQGPRFPADGRPRQCRPEADGVGRRVGARVGARIGSLDPSRAPEVKRALGYGLDWPELKVL